MTNYRHLKFICQLNFKANFEQIFLHLDFESKIAVNIPLARFYDSVKNSYANFRTLLQDLCLQHLRIPNEIELFT